MPRDAVRYGVNTCIFWCFAKKSRHDIRRLVPKAATRVSLVLIAGSCPLRPVWVVSKHIVREEGEEVHPQVVDADPKEEKDQAEAPEESQLLAELYV